MHHVFLSSPNGQATFGQVSLNCAKPTQQQVQSLTLACNCCNTVLRFEVQGANPWSCEKGYAWAWTSQHALRMISAY